MNRLLFIILGFLAISSCNTTTKEDNSIKLASVGSTFLYEEELFNKLPQGLNPKDSISFVSQYIDNWTKEQVILQKAEEVLSEESKNVNERLENYRKSLIIHTYEQAYIENRLDTIILEEEIEQYYNENKKDFALKGYIIKAYHGTFPDSLDLTNLNSWYKLQHVDDYPSLQGFSQIHSNNYHLDTTNWIYFDQVLEKIPLENNIHISSFIKNKKDIHFVENNNAYYLNVLDFKLKDDISPLAFERDKIKTIILNQRTQKLRKELNENLYKDALNKQDIVIYNKK